MRLIGVLVLLVGIGLAGGALFYAKKVLSSYQTQATAAPAQSAPATVPVIVAAERIDYGQEIEESLVKIIDWPAAAVPQGAFTSPEDLIGDVMSERRVALRVIEANEPVLEAKVSGFGEDSRIAMLLGEGRRAFSLPINAVSGVAGFISPGDRVDILFAERVDGNLTSRVILADVLVIAVDQTSQGNTSLGPRVGRTATVEVDAREAQKLSLAQQIGSLSLTLRGAGDVAKEGEENSTVSIDDIRGVSREEEAAPERRTVRVRRAGQAAEIELQQ
ncbi:MAG: Flp pilus assembly protein CpaB [Pseudomonadota bacterium]